MNPKLNKDHWIVALAVILTVSLIQGIAAAFKTVRWLWRLFVHAVFYRFGPGKITFPETSRHSISWSNAYLPFAVSNPVFAAKERLTQEEAGALVASLMKIGQTNPTSRENWGKDGPCDQLTWNAIPYRPWRAPALSLRRRPDDVQLRAEVQWQPLTDHKLAWTA